MSLSIATWNLLSTNKTQLHAIKFLLEHNVDIACLQELAPTSVHYLKSLPGYHFDYGIDHYAKGEPFFIGILSRFPYKKSEKIAFNCTISPSPISRFFQWDEGKYFMFHDFERGGRTLRVFNLHLTFGAGPSYRLQQLREVCQYLLKDADNVLTGDFNSFIQFPYSYIIGPLFSLKNSDYRASELREMKNFLVNRGFRSSLKKAVTQAFFRVHIDHIFLPTHWSEIDCYFETKRFGSDHRMVVVRTKT